MTAYPFFMLAHPGQHDPAKFVTPERRLDRTMPGDLPIVQGEPGAQGLSELIQQRDPNPLGYARVIGMAPGHRVSVEAAGDGDVRIASTIARTQIERTRQWLALRVEEPRHDAACVFTHARPADEQVAVRPDGECGVYVASVDRLIDDDLVRGVVSNAPQNDGALATALELRLPGDPCGSVGRHGDVRPPLRARQCVVDVHLGADAPAERIELLGEDAPTAKLLAFGGPDDKDIARLVGIQGRVGLAELRERVGLGLDGSVRHRTGGVVLARARRRDGVNTRCQAHDDQRACERTTIHARSPGMNRAGRWVPAYKTSLTTRSETTRNRVMRGLTGLGTRRMGQIHNPTTRRPKRRQRHDSIRVPGRFGCVRS